MSDRPIIFSGPMIRALLDGRKTQTRRVLKPQPHKNACLDGSYNQKGAGWFDDYKVDGHMPQYGISGHVSRPGDRLWVREAWRTPTSFNGNSEELVRDCKEAGYRRTWAPIEYEADGDRDNWEWGDFVPGRLRPSIHMPRWASRLTLVVSDVRVQRVQEISEEDAIAEGITPYRGYTSSGGTVRNIDNHGNYIAAFCDLWDSLNAKRGQGWDEDPWVAAITFTVHHCNIDEMEKAA